MDAIDRKLLNLIQQDLPLSEYPFHAIAKELGIEPEEVVERLQALKTGGYIRRIGGVLNGAKLGFTGSLIAMQVPEERFYEVAQLVNSYSGVTHNYRRNHRWNLWFTLSTRSVEERWQTLREIKQATGVTKLLELPAEAFFKLRIFFDMEGESDGRVG